MGKVDVAMSFVSQLVQKSKQVSRAGPGAQLTKSSVDLLPALCLSGAPPMRLPDAERGVRHEGDFTLLISELR